MAKIRAGCASCGEPLQPVGSGALRCPRCDAGISPPERQQPSGVQLAPRESAIQEPPQETRIQLQPGGSGQSSPGLLPRRAAVARSWWDAALASVFWSLVGIPAGAVAAATGFVVLMLSGAAGVGSSDGTGGAALVFIPALGAVVGFGVGFAVPLLRHAWKVRRAGQVVGGTFAGAVAGVLFPILADPWMPNQDWALAAAWIAIPVGALVGFLLGFVRLPWHLPR